MNGTRTATGPPGPDWALRPRTYRICDEATLLLGRLDERADRLGARPGLVRSTLIRDALASAGLAGTSMGLREAFTAELVESPREGWSSPIPPIRLTGPHLLGYDEARRRARDHVALLSRWLAPGEEEQPQIVKAAFVHYRFEVLQAHSGADPHRARAFSTAVLVRSGLLRDEVLPLSVWLSAEAEEYREQVREVVETGSVHKWVEFYATAIRDQASMQLKLINRLHDLAARHARLLPRTGTLPLVAADLIGFPVVDHRAIRERHHVTTRAASGFTRRLAELGVVVPWKSRTHGQVFVCREVLRLLGDNPLSPPVL